MLEIKQKMSWLFRNNNFISLQSVLTLSRINFRIIIRRITRKKTQKGQKQIKYSKNYSYNQLLERMASKVHLEIENDQSQFRIEENSRKRKASGQNKNNKYSVISYEKRVQLISLASSKGYSISRAARELGIKPSTGKFIVKCFRDYGKIMKKTSCQAFNHTENQHQESRSEMVDQQTQKKQKQSNSSSQPLGREQNKEVLHVANSYIQMQEVPSYFLGYSCEQTMASQFLFYPSYENMELITVPIYCPQVFQY